MSSSLSSPGRIVLFLTGDAAESPRVMKVFNVAIGDEDPDVRNTALEVLEQLLKDKDGALLTNSLWIYAPLTCLQPNFKSQWHLSWGSISQSL